MSLAQRAGRDGRGGRGVVRRVAPLTAQDAGLGILGRFRQVLLAQPDAIAVADAERELTFAQVAAEAARTLTLIREQLGPAPLPFSPRSSSSPASSSSPSSLSSSLSLPSALSPPASSSRSVLRRIDLVADESAPIALLHEHAAGAVPAILGVLASGYPLVVLDSRTPRPRLRALADRVGVRLAVSDPVNRATATGLAERVLTPASTIVLGTGEDPLADAAPLWAQPADPGAIVALGFTSGSTGRPKVVLNDDAMLVRDAWANSVGTGVYDADDVVALTLPMGFHAGLMAVVAGLLTGATLKLRDVRALGVDAVADGERARLGLAGWIAAERVSVLLASPGILRGFLAARPDPQDLAGLRSLTLSGEAAHGRDVQAARALLPAGCVVHHRYGSSETGLISDFAIAGDAGPVSGALPVGRPVPGTRITIVDDAGRPLPTGEVGTVTVTAPAMSGGYRDDPAASAAFRANPDGTRTFRSRDVGRLDQQGRLHLLGRRDHSVKIRGYLVEPGEVDAALFALPGIREAVTVGLPRPNGSGNRLVSYVVPTDARPGAADVRTRLRDRLPGHLVPETVVFLPALPRTDRGKLDRSALPAPPTRTPGERAEDLTEWENVVAAVWVRVLGLEALGPDDDFFELGGDSLSAERLMTALIDDLGVAAADAHTRLLAQAPTLREFCRRLTRRPGRGQGTLIPLLVATTSPITRPPLFLVAGAGGLGVGLMPLAKHLGPDQPTYALQAHALERRGMPDWSVRSAARRHLSQVRAVQPQGPYHLGGHSFGALVALEMAHQLRAAGQEVDLLVVLDSFPPEPALQPRPPARTMARRIRDGAGLIATGILPTPGLGQYWRFHRQSMLLSRFYRCPRWPGATLVVVAESAQKAARSAWGPHLSGPWTTTTVGGDHLAMMREPWVGQIADAIAEALRTTPATP